MWLGLSLVLLPPVSNIREEKEGEGEGEGGEGGGGREREREGEGEGGRGRGREGAWAQWGLACDWSYHPEYLT